jgi:putative oxidoreductase
MPINLVYCTNFINNDYLIMHSKNMSCFMGCSCTKNIGLLFLRIAIGLPFIVHGLAKLKDIAGTTGFFASLGLSPFFTYLVGGGEVLAGIMILLGIWSFIGGYIVSIIMLVAYSLIKHKMPFMGGYELDFVFFFGGLAIAMLGSGKYSLVQKPCNTCLPGTCVDNSMNTCTHTNCNCGDCGKCK